MHICKCTISVSSYQITVSSVALSPCAHTHNSLISFILLWVSPYWKIRERFNLVGRPVLYNAQNSADDKAFNFHIVRGLNTSLERLPASCYLTILYICAHIITISKHTRKAPFHHGERRQLCRAPRRLEEQEILGSVRGRHPEGDVPSDVTVNLSRRRRLNQRPSGISGKWRRRGS